jgi:hypothetical protein
MTTTGSAARPDLTAHQRVARPRLRARVEIVLWRHGLVWPIALVALLAAVLLAVLQVRPLRAELAQSARTIALAQTEAAATKLRPMATEQASDQTLQLAHVEAALRGAGRIDEQMRVILAAATHHGIELPRAEYQSSVDTPTRVARVQATFAIKAGYPRLRGFVEEVLRALPNASIDHISFKRDAVGLSEVEATVRLSLWSIEGEAIRPSVPASSPRPGT